MPARASIARIALAAATGAGVPLFTGNGFLAREVMALTPPGAGGVLPLQGGMGLSTSVAAGYLLSGRVSAAIVLEGDGNHLMGISGALLAGALDLHLVHVVACNGVYQSTGGQHLPIPAGPDRVHAAAAMLSYRLACPAASDGELEDALRQALRGPGPSLIYAAEDPAAPAPARSGATTAAYAAALAAPRSDGGTRQ
jgi:thiamine pyrophosphate-dependent acetolactate synthase large subunit-like protein